MDIRLLQEADYDDTLVKWWSDWGWVAPPKESLPDNGVGGFMVSKDKQNICAAFLYQTNSKIAWMEFLVSNKEYRGSDRGEAIELLVTAISAQAKEYGFTMLYTSTNHKVLAKRYEKCGYKESSKNCTEMIKIL